MKNISIIVNVAVLLIIAALGYAVTISLEHRTPIIAQPSTPIEAVKNQQPAPDFTFTTTDGKTHSLKDFKNKIVILNFWASWCPPCIKEFPHFIKAAKEFENDVIFIGVSSDLDEAAMTKFTDKLGDLPPNTFITLDEDQSITKDTFQTYQLPETILIDQSQIMRTKIIGADWDYETLQQHIKALIK